MKSNGIIRRLDSLGRVVIPKEIRKKLDISEGEAVAIVNEANQVIIRKYHEGCIFCGSEENIIQYKNMFVCSKCRMSLNK